MVTIQDGIEGKVCGKCRQWQILTNFYKDRTQKDGYYHQCKDCEFARKLHPDKSCGVCERKRRDFKDYGGNLDEKFGKSKSHCLKCIGEYNKLRRVGERNHAVQVKANEKRRDRERGSDGIDRGHCHPYEWNLLLLVHGKQCLYQDCTEITNLENDHIIPHSKGGSNEIWNRQQLCKTHNDSKGNRDNIDYRPDQGILAMAIHNLRIGQCNDRKQKKRYYEWVVAQIEEKGPHILLTLMNIFDWLEPKELQLAA